MVVRSTSRLWDQVQQSEFWILKIDIGNLINRLFVLLYISFESFKISFLIRLNYIIIDKIADDHLVTICSSCQIVFWNLNCKYYGTFASSKLLLFAWSINVQIISLQFVFYDFLWQTTPSSYIFHRYVLFWFIALIVENLSRR